MKPRTILILGWIVFVIYAYPGYLGPGAADQLVDARVGQFTDWNPAMMTEVWRIAGRLVDGPSAMLFIQSTLLLLGAYQLLRDVLVDRAAAYTAVAILWFPPVIASTAVIAPGPMAASMLVAGYAALRSASPRWRVAGYGLFVIAGGISLAALVGALPLVIATWRRGLLRALVAWFVIALVAIGVSYVLVDAPSQRPEAETAMHDIAGVLRYAPTLPGEQIGSLLTGVPLAAEPGDLQRRAKAAYPKPGRYTGGVTKLFGPIEPDQYRAVIAARDRIAKAQPKAYLRHRLHVLTLELGFTKPWHPFIDSFVPAHVDGAQLAYLSTHSLAQRTLLTPVRWLSRTSLFRPHLYLFATLIFGIWAVVRRRRDAIAVLASGLVYELALAFTATPTPQFFDSQWLVVSSLLGALMIAIGELEARHERIGQQAPLDVADDDRVQPGD